MESSHSQTPDTADALQAAWALMLPHVRWVQVVGQVPPALRRWWERHGVSVEEDVEPRRSTSGAHATAMPEGRLVIVWSSASGASPTVDFAAIPGQETVVWTSPAGPWDALRCLWHQRTGSSGWRRHERLFAWPQIRRPRQIVPQRYWRSTRLHAHRRSDRRWKNMLRRSDLGRLLAPGWLTRWLPRDGVAHSTWLEDILTQASHATGRELTARDLRLSPNGVAIVPVSGRRCGAAVGILKIPLDPLAGRRVATNARALQWMQQGGVPGAWSEAPPGLLATGATHGCAWTLEEFVDGTEAQTWRTEPARAAIRHLTGLLRAFQEQGVPLRAAEHPRLLQFDASVESIARLLPTDLAQRLQEVWRQTVRTLEDVEVPRVPQHGDCKLENVLGDPRRIQHLHVLDWELWTSAGLPLLDVLHLLLSRRRRTQGVSIGGSICRWLLDGELADWEKRILDELSQGLDRRYVDSLPLLYWVERVGPVAARGAWPDEGWLRANVLPVIERLQRQAVEVVA